MFACSVQIINDLDSQSKFQMFTLVFSGGHDGVHWRYVHQHGGFILGPQPRSEGLSSYRSRDQ